MGLSACNLSEKFADLTVFILLHSMDFCQIIAL